jgi:hypothetical protein
VAALLGGAVPEAKCQHYERGDGRDVERKGHAGDGATGRHDAIIDQHGGSRESIRALLLMLVTN